MELMILMGVAFALCVTVLVVAVKLVIALVLVPVKMLGSLSASFGQVFWVPLQIGGALLVVVAALVGLLSLPVAIPLALVAGLLLALVC